MKKYIFVALFLTVPMSSLYANWPTYRSDKNRTGYSTETLPDKLSPSWSFEFASGPIRAWPNEIRMKWDAAFQPIIAEGKVFLGSSSDNCLYALDLKEGSELWRFHTQGPIRFAPAYWDKHLYAVSDDGFIYCVNATTGKLKWKFRGGAEESYVPGNGHLISRWPARGAAVIEDGIVYFGCGIWPTDGIYIYALNATDGKLKWCNDSSGQLSILQPHAALSRSGLSAQGYFTICGKKLLVPTGRALPAILDKETGKYEDWGFSSIWNRTGGGGDIVAFPNAKSFYTGNYMYTLPGVVASPNTRTYSSVLSTPKGLAHFDGKSIYFNKIESEVSSDGKRKTFCKINTADKSKLFDISKSELRWCHMVATANKMIVAYNNQIEVFDLKTKNKLAQFTVSGTVWGLAISNGSLIASTTEGKIYCFSDKSEAKPKKIVQKVQKPSGATLEIKTKIETGFALLVDCKDLKTIETFATKTKSQIIVLSNDKKIISKMRNALSDEGLYGNRVIVIEGKLGMLGDVVFPKHFARLIVDFSGKMKKTVIESLLQPYGGEYHNKKEPEKNWVRSGGFEGEGVWTHQYMDPSNSLCSQDDVVRGPLSARWYTDLNLKMPNRSARFPIPLYLNGRLFIEGVDELLAVDAFTGQELWHNSYPGILAHLRGGMKGTDVAGSNICLSEQYLFLVKGEECLKLDQATGVEKGRFKVPEGKAWGFLAYADGILYGSVANVDFHVSPAYSRSNMSKLYSESSQFFAMDPESGEVLWKYKAQRSIRHNAIAISNGSVFLIDRAIAKYDAKFPIVAVYQGQLKKNIPPKPDENNHPTGTLICLDAKSGKELWRNENNIYGTMLLVAAKRRILVMCYGFATYPVASDYFADRVAAFSLQEGKRIWELENFEYGGSRIVINDDILIAEPYAYELETGKKKKKEDFHFIRTIGCGAISASKHLIIFRSGTLGYVDMKKPDTVHSFGGIRPNCWINSIVAGGLVLVPDNATGCTCSYLMHSSVGLERRVPTPVITYKRYGIAVSAEMPEKGCTMRYTTDGSAPTVSSKIFEGSMAIPKNATLKIKAFKYGIPASETVFLGEL